MVQTPEVSFTYHQTFILWKLKLSSKFTCGPLFEDWPSIHPSKTIVYSIAAVCWHLNFCPQISYGRFSPKTKEYRDLDIFIQQKDGKKILDSGKRSALCSRLKQEMLHPLRVIIANRGPDTELLVANPVELSGKGRPRVFYDVTYALKTLGICVFSVRKSVLYTLL